jgi:YD repeat-containing protein
MVKRAGTGYQAYYNSGSGWTSYLSSQTISAIPSQSPAGPFATSTISNWQAWANFSNVLVSSDTPAVPELLGSGGNLEVTSNGFSGPGNAFTGNDVKSYSDLSIPGRGIPLGFDRTYNSLLGSEATTTLAPYGNLSPGWTDGYNVFTTKDSAGDVTVQQGDGSAVTFAYSGSAYTAPTRVLATLQTNTSSIAPNCPTSALVLTTHNQTRYAFYQITASAPPGQPSGALCEALDVNGYPTELTYNSGDTQLTTVTECTTVSGTSCGTNRTLTFAYANSSYPNSITSVTSSANAGTGALKVSFTYNGSGKLATSADADGNTTRYGYNAEGLLNQIQTPNQYAGGSSGTQIWYDTSGRARYISDPAAVAAGYTGVTAYAYQCNYVYGTDTCSNDGTQTTTTVDADGNETQDIFADGLMTSETDGVGSSVAATTNYTFDPNTLGVNTTTSPANGSGASYTISYTNWFGTGTYLGDVQCSVSPGNPGATVNVTGASWSSANDQATLTFSSTTAPAVGGTVVASGISPSGYNGTFQVVSSSSTSVTYALSSNPGTYSSGGSFWLVQGDVTSSTYNSTYPSLVATTTSPLEQAISYNGACNTGTPTYTTTNYYGASNGTCNQTGLAAWLLACTVEQTGGSPASLTTTYTYDQNGDSNVGDLTDAEDPNGNHATSAYDSYGDVTCSSVMPATPGTCATGGTTPDVTTTTYEPDGQVAASVEPNGNASGATAALWTTTSTYDAAGNLLTETDPGTSLAITGASCTGTTATVDFATAANPPALNSYVSITGVNPSGYNGSYQVTTSNSAYIKYTVGSCPGSWSSGGTVMSETVNTYDGDNNVTFSRDDQGNMSGTAYSLDDQSVATSDPGTSLSVTSGTCSGGTAQVNYATTSNNPPAGTYVFISDVGATGYNGSFIAATSTTTHATYTDPGCSGSASAGGFIAPSASATTYDAAGNELTSTDYSAGANVTSYAYDSLGRQVTQTIPGTSLSVASGTSCAGNVVSLYFPSGSTPPAVNSYIIVTGVTPSGYDGTYQVATSHSTYVTYSVGTCPGTYTSGGNLISATYTAYYANGNQEYSIDGAGSEELDTYYPSDSQYQVTTGYGTSGAETETTTYDAAGDTLTDQTGSNTTTNTYNDVGWNLTSQDQLGATTTNAYDTDGNVITETGAGTSIPVTGGSWVGTSCGGSTGEAFLNFASNNPPSVQGTITVSGVSPSGYNGTFTVASSSSTQVGYCMTSGPGSWSSGGTIQVPTVTHNTYDGANRLLTSCTDGIPIGSLCGGSPASNPTVTNVYDNDSNVITGKDAGSGDTSGQSKNPWSQSGQAEIGGQDVSQGSSTPATIAVTGASWSSSGCSGSGEETLTFASTNPAPAVNSYIVIASITPSSFDGTFQVAASTSTSVSYCTASPGTYSSGGTISSETYTTYNASGQPSTVTNPNGATATYTYDGSGRTTEITYSDGTPTVAYAYNPDGTVASMTDGSGTTSYTYDGQGNLATVTDGNGDEMKYAWDPAGNLTSETYPDGHTVTYAYNQLNQMVSVSDYLSHTTNFTYDSAGNLSTITYPNGTTATYGYNSAENLNKIATTNTSTHAVRISRKRASQFAGNGPAVSRFWATQAREPCEAPVSPL